MNKLLPDYSLSENVSVLARCLLDLYLLALIEVHVAQKEAGLAHILTSQNDCSELLDLLSFDVILGNSIWID